MVVQIKYRTFLGFKNAFTLLMLMPSTFSHVYGLRHDKWRHFEQISKSASTAEFPFSNSFGLEVHWMGKEKSKVPISHWSISFFLKMTA